MGAGTHIIVPAPTAVHEHTVCRGLSVRLYQNELVVVQRVIVQPSEVTFLHIIAQTNPRVAPGTKSENDRLLTKCICFRIR